jgi:arylsulfatase A-like enzyme
MWLQIFPWFELANDLAAKPFIYYIIDFLRLYKIEFHGPEMQRRLFLKDSAVALAALASACSSGCSKRVNVSKKRYANVILISIDTMRADHAGFNGYRDIQGRSTTPFLDTVAEYGIVFRNHYANAPSTHISHAAILTGLLPHQSGVANFFRKIPDEIALVSELFSKMHFDTFASTCAPQLRPSTGFSGFSHFSFPSEPKKRFDRAVDDILNFFQSSDTSRPTFFFLHTYDPHLPYMVDLESNMVGATEIEERMLRESGRRAIPDPHTIKKYYDAQIRFADSQIGRFLDAIAFDRRRDLLVVTADHGECLGDEGYKTMPRMHLHSYEPVVKVPLLIAGAGIENGREVFILRRVSI